MTGLIGYRSYIYTEIIIIVFVIMHFLLFVMRSEPLFPADQIAHIKRNCFCLFMTEATRICADGGSVCLCGLHVDMNWYEDSMAGVRATISGL